MDIDQLFGPAHNRVNPFNLGVYLGPRGISEEGDRLAQERGLKIFYRFGVLPHYRNHPVEDTGLLCPRCERKNLSTYKDTRSSAVGWRYVCKLDREGVGCRLTIMPTNNTLLFNVRLRELQTDKIVKAMLMWLEQETQVRIMQYVGIGSWDTVSPWCGYFRDVAHKIALHDFTMMGGEGDYVEIDETHLWKRKYGVGRLTQDIWLFGGISRTTRHSFGLIVPNRTRETLLEVMQQLIDPDTFVCSDSWGAYGGAIRASFRGLGRVNHTEQFLNPPRSEDPLFAQPPINPECIDREFQGPRWPHQYGLLPVRYSTQVVESSWKQLKKTVAQQANLETAQKYVGEWMYRWNILRYIPTLTGRLERFLQDCRRAYPGIGGGPMMSDDITMCRCRECEQPA